MKRFKSILFVFIYGASLTLFMYCNRGEDHKEVIKQTKDERGLTSVIYKDGKDTFALDYATPAEINSLTK